VATKHTVEVTDASVVDGHFRATCTCTCGWQGGVAATKETVALSAAARARVQHLAADHPEQAPNGFFRPRAAARYQHPRSLSAAARQGKRWRRHAACACGWSDSVLGPSPRATARAARRLHVAHVDLQTGRAPWRDWVVLAVVVVVVLALIVALANEAIVASGGDPLWS